MTNQNQTQNQTATYVVVNLKTGERVTMTLDPKDPESVKTIVALAKDPNVKVVAQ